jgi:hypothetical protein
MAAPPAIGVATARGAFRVNDAPVRGNGTLFSGTRVETAAIPGDLALSSGQRLALGANSAALVFADHIVLERGESRLAPAAPNKTFSVEAKTLRIEAAEPGASGRVSLGANDTILVASATGHLRVLTAAGVPLASVAAGRTLRFDAQPSSAGTTQLTGRVNRQEGRLMLTDEATATAVELRAGKVTQSAVEKQIGKRVHVTGTHVPGSKPMAMEVQLLAQANQQSGASAGNSGNAGNAGGNSGGGTPGGSGGTGGAAGGTGGGAGGGVGTSAIIAGVVITGATIGTVVGITQSGDDNISD